MDSIKYFISVESDQYEIDEYIFINRLPNINESIMFRDRDLYTVTNIIYMENNNGEYEPSRLIVKKGV